MQYITVDTGGPNDIWPGCLVVWLHVPRGGYGFTVNVPAKVLKVTKSRVTIEVRTSNNSAVKRVVAPGALRWERRLIP